MPTMPASIRIAITCSTAVQRSSGPCVLAPLWPRPACARQRAESLQEQAMDETMQATVDDARRSLAALRAALDAATLALARRCGSGGRLSGAALDAAQVPSFELAWAAADL